MSLVKKTTLTKRKAAANRRNASQSTGPATPEGKERTGAAHLRHGFYAKAQEDALRDLGEDPAHFEELLAGLRQEFTPQGALQDELVIRLARVLWLMGRADRSQEGAALRRARSADQGRDNRLHAQMMRLKMTAERLRLLVKSVAREHYVTTPEDLEKMKNLHQEEVLKDMGDITLALFYQLQAPGTDENGIDEMEKARRMVAQAKEIFGIGATASFPPQANVAPGSSQQETPSSEASGVNPAPADPGVGATEEEKDERYPNIIAADWEARERPRQLLENILTRQVESCEAQRKALLRESVAGPSPYELAAEIAPSHADALLMRRMQDANMREVRRLTNLLLKIKRQEGKREAVEASEEDIQSHDIIENKGS